MTKELEERLQVGSWEYFCDVAYFDMWCVRRIGERTFGQGFHVLNHDSAKALAEELARMEAEAAALIEAQAAEIAGLRRAVALNTLLEIDGPLYDEAAATLARYREALEAIAKCEASMNGHIARQALGDPR